MTARGKRKFLALKNTKKKTGTDHQSSKDHRYQTVGLICIISGEPNIPEEILRAKDIYRHIESKWGVLDLDDSANREEPPQNDDFDLEDLDLENNDLPWNSSEQGTPSQLTSSIDEIVDNISSSSSAQEPRVSL